MGALKMANTTHNDNIEKFDAAMNDTTWTSWIFSDSLSGIFQDLYSTSGDDNYVADAVRNNRALLGDGDDVLYTAAKSNSSRMNAISGGAGDDFIFGNSAREYLDGGSGDDKLYGNEGKDFLYGGAGNDILSGGSDANRLWGGKGNDTYDLSGKDMVKDTAGSDNYVVASGAHVMISDIGSDVNSMSFEFRFRDDVTFTRKGDDLEIHAADGTRALLQNTYGEDASFFELVDARGHVFAASFVDLAKGEHLTGTEILAM
jgi:Ca2+-binding RTX toxin-like protein